MVQQGPPTRFVVRPPPEDGLGTGATPKEPRAFPAPMAPAAYGPCDGPTPHRQLEGHALRLRPAGLVRGEGRTRGAARLALAASAEGTDRRHARCPLAPQQPAALGRAPAGPCRCTPVLAPGCDGAPGVHGGRAVPQRLPLCGSSPSRWAQRGPPLP